MKTQSIKSWGVNSVSYWLTFLVAAGIIFIGIRFLAAPYIAADGYGIPLDHRFILRLCLCQRNSGYLFRYHPFSISNAQESPCNRHTF